MRLLRQTPAPRKAARSCEPQNPWANDGPDVQTLSLAGEATDHATMDFDDPFTKSMLDFEPTGRFTPPIATRDMLLQMEASDVFVVQWTTSARVCITRQSNTCQANRLRCHVRTAGRILS